MGNPSGLNAAELRKSINPGENRVSSLGELIDTLPSDLLQMSNSYLSQTTFGIVFIVAECFETFRIFYIKGSIFDNCAQLHYKNFFLIKYINQNHFSQR